MRRIEAKVMADKKTQMHQLQSEPAEGSRETVERELDRQEKDTPKSKDKAKAKSSAAPGEKRRA